MKPITPTVGRIVLYKDSEGNVNPAIITKVGSDREIQVQIFGQVNTHVIQTVPLRQPGDPEFKILPYCEWMPYQVKKDYGSESGEKDVGTTEI